MQLASLSENLIKSGVLRQPLRVNRSVGGGCINDCFEVQSGHAVYFLKTNSADQYPGMFAAEAAGLNRLRGASDLKVPEVVAQVDVDGQAYLMLAFVSSAPASKDFWENFGRGLAALHCNTSKTFGLDIDNYIGSLPQRNTPHPDWSLFFLEHRLLPQIELGIAAGWADRRQFRQAEAIARIVEDEFPKEDPALLHGDLWSGNFLTTADGAAIVDPAVYYGHREMELAFTQLFGGFREPFYEAYHTAFPIAPDFKKRLPILQLYPLLVHANLFGSHYISQVLGHLRNV